MTAKYVPVSSATHREFKIKDSRTFDHVKGEQLVPVVMHEFGRVAADLPVVFVKDGENGKFLPVALMGLQPQENVFADGSEWPFGYVPMAMRRYPFSLQFADNDNSKVVLCFDENSALVSKTEGNALFNDNGEQTDYFKARAENALRFVEQAQVTGKAIELLVEKDLLESRQLNVQLENGKSYTLNGVYVINEKKFNELKDEEFAELRKRGLLSVIYAHLLSLQQVQKIAMKKLAQGK